MIRFRRPVVGVSIGSHDATACIPTGESYRIVKRTGLEDGVAALLALLEDPHVRHYSVAGGVRIALLSPLVEDRCLHMPLLSAAQAELALAVQASRYFATGRDGSIVAARFLDTAPGLVIASLSSIDLIARLHEALRSARLRCQGVYSAIPVMLFSSEFGKEGFVEHDGVLIAADRSAGRVSGIRRIPWNSVAAAEFFKDRDIDELAASEHLQARVLAARAIAQSDAAAPEFRPHMLVSSRRTRARVRAGAILLAAALIVAAGFAVEAQQIEEQLRRTRAARAADRQAITAALQERQRYENLAASLDQIAGVTSAPSLPRVLNEALGGLPSDVLVDMLEVGGGELILSGTGARSDAVFAALRASPVSRTVEWIGPVTGVSENGSRRESFGIAVGLMSSEREP